MLSKYSEPSRKPFFRGLALAARLDSLQSRLKSLETRATEQDAAKGNAKPTFPGSGMAASSSTRDTSAASPDGEIAVLVEEVKALTALLRSGAAMPVDWQPAGNGKRNGYNGLSDLSGHSRTKAEQIIPLSDEDMKDS